MPRKLEGISGGKLVQAESAHQGVKSTLPMITPVAGPLVTPHQLFSALTTGAVDDIPSSFQRNWLWMSGYTAGVKCIITNN
ncbi:MAG: hypothetical protein IPJ46_18215 [Anaerolineales bacterium]|nr:hypothetical protein [Anaerolineales bacterium]